MRGGADLHLWAPQLLQKCESSFNKAPQALQCVN
jgi:hypothetical protein